jgi:hypothetical protein
VQADVLRNGAGLADLLFQQLVVHMDARAEDGASGELISGFDATAIQDVSEGLQQSHLR